jgi:hypothetical protein
MGRRPVARHDARQPAHQARPAALPGRMAVANGMHMTAA